MRPRIRPILLAVPILVMGSLNVSGFASTGDTIYSSGEGIQFSLVAERDAAPRPHSNETDRRTKEVQRGLEHLGLSKRQMDDIGRITAEFRKSVAPLGPTAQALASERNKLVNQGAEKDRPRIAEIDLEIGRIRKQVIEARSRLQAKLMEILSPEQRVKFQRMMQQGRQTPQSGGGR